MKVRPHILPIIILAQFASTSLWFAGNAVIDELITKTGFGQELVGYVISSVQLGFIIGTLTFAVLMIADRFSPSRVFLICALLGALCNISLLSDELTKSTLLIARFGTGFFLAGIYPVGMKIAADYYEKGLGKALGFLVGALVIGSGLPFLFSGTSWGGNADIVITATSALAVFGGLLIWIFVPNGPFRLASTKLQLNTGKQLFKILRFRKAALGYFGHMWELYAFWAFTPSAIRYFNKTMGNNLFESIWTGLVFAVGGISCMLGGIISQRYGSKKVATTALFISGFLCLISPILFELPAWLFLFGWCLWGMAVTADSPQFSNLVASAIPHELKGTGLTLVNCIGFAISILSIELLSNLIEYVDTNYLFLILAIGPICGLWQLNKKIS